MQPPQVGSAVLPSHPSIRFVLHPFQVKGLLLDSEVLSAKKEFYLKGAHVLVGAYSPLCLQPPCMHADSRPLRAVCLPAVCSRGAAHRRWSSAGTPELIAAALQPPDAVEAVQHVDVVAVDEVDACFQVRGWLCFGVGLVILSSNCSDLSS